MSLIKRDGGWGHICIWVKPPQLKAARPERQGGREHFSSLVSFSGCKSWPWWQRGPDFSLQREPMAREPERQNQSNKGAVSIYTVLTSARLCTRWWGCKIEWWPSSALPGQSRKSQGHAQWSGWQQPCEPRAAGAQGHPPSSPPPSLAPDQAHRALKKDLRNEYVHSEIAGIPCWSLKKLRLFKRKEATECPYLHRLPLKTPQLTCVHPTKTEKWRSPSTWESVHYG